MFGQKGFIGILSPIEMVLNKHIHFIIKVILVGLAKEPNVEDDDSDLMVIGNDGLRGHPAAPITYPNDRDNPGRPTVSIAITSTLVPQLPSFCQRRHCILGGCDEADQAKVTIVSGTSVEQANLNLDKMVWANTIFVVAVRAYASGCAGMELHVEPYRHDRKSLTLELRSTLKKRAKAPYFKGKTKDC